MKKILTAVITVAAAVALFTVPALAADGGAGTNVFATLYGYAAEHAGSILAALSFAASALLAVTYKRGLLPIIKGALGSTAETVARLGERSESISKGSAELLGQAAERLGEAEATVALLGERLTSLEEKLADCAKLYGERENLRLIMEAQIDMLYGIFMSSSLPAYQKEAVGERIADMKRALAPSESENA